MSTTPVPAGLKAIEEYGLQKTEKVDLRKGSKFCLDFNKKYSLKHVQEKISALTDHILKEATNLISLQKSKISCLIFSGSLIGCLLGSSTYYHVYLLKNIDKNDPKKCLIDILAILINLFVGALLIRFFYREKSHLNELKNQKRIAESWQQHKEHYAACYLKDMEKEIQKPSLYDYYISWN